MKRRTKSLRETKPAYRTRRAPAVRRKRTVAKRAPQAQPQKEIALHKIGVAGKPITYRVPNREWVEIIERNDALYEKYGRQLEAEHKGEFVAIGLSGQVILGKNLDEVLLPAVERFGKMNFALKRVGYDFLMTIR